MKNGAFSGSLGQVVYNIAVGQPAGDVQLKYAVGKFNIWLDLRCKSRKGLEGGAVNGGEEDCQKNLNCTTSLGFLQKRCW